MNSRFLYSIQRYRVYIYDIDKASHTHYSAAEFQNWNKKI